MVIKEPDDEKQASAQVSWKTAIVTFLCVYLAVGIMAVTAFLGGGLTTFRYVGF